jgi:hypothetical protein
LIDARTKLTGLIRQAVEDQAGLELVTSEGHRTPRDGYLAEHLLAQQGNATVLAVHAPAGRP